ncbi:hypothetical protein [Burkholderia sp. USMB20]|uniref:hypothetical protein n=1 Tax=Burkholderia sp. USMB20 TaxID=1571773 RepID=UPI0005CF8A06|nr:hypothetical protein [Burkholderia sp. USMB20]
MPSGVSIPGPLKESRPRPQAAALRLHPSDRSRRAFIGWNGALADRHVAGADPCIQRERDDADERVDRGQVVNTTIGDKR